jgi:hypothetical protein
MTVRPLFFAFLAGCGLDESGLFESQDAAQNGDVVAPDVQTNDVQGSDVVTTNDAGADVILEQDVTVFDAPPEATIEAGPILTITGGTYTLLAEDAGVCSMNSNTATSFQLQNDRDAAVDLVWVDFACTENPYGTIAAGGQKTQNTYETHVWRVRNDADKAFLAGFVLSSTGPFTVTVH